MYLKEVLDALSVVAIGLATDTFHFLDLSSLASSLDILEVNLGVLAEVDDRAQKVEQTLKALQIENNKCQ